ncbi:hypothetical protein EWB00_000471 [Schistosoma japonicum]|uniref:Uncharacterized protein n=2 Tax=Schistosoma japonicum TaxID=6182 RepID=A0A4Z2DIN4_SCHJA|nr:hypothetical protein EWB00_000471 [Schistosoma japonicum]
MYDQTEVEFLVNLIISTQNSARSFSNYKYDYHAINTASRFSTASTTVPLLPSPSLSSFTNYPRQKILICGLPDDISPCLDYAMIAKPGVIDYSSLIIASTDIDELIVNYFGKTKIHLVNWDETDYEEMLIERVRPRSDNFTIPLVIEFQPTIRRMKRIRELLEKNGTLVIPSENPEWRIRYTNLMNSFTENNGTLIKLAENVFDAGFTRQIDHLLGRRHMHSRIYFGYEKPIESPQKFID